MTTTVARSATALAPPARVPPSSRRAADPRRLRLRAPDAPDNAIAHARDAELAARCSRRARTRTIDASELHVGLPDGPDGQLRGRPPQHRRRPRRLPGLHAHRPRDRDRRVRGAMPCCATRVDAAPPQAAARARARPAVAGRRAQPRAAARRDGGRWPAAGGVPRVEVHAFLDGRDTPPRSAAASLAIMDGVCANASPARASPRSAAATTRWTATSAGSASPRPTR